MPLIYYVYMHIYTIMYQRARSPPKSCASFKSGGNTSHELCIILIVIIICSRVPSVCEQIPVSVILIISHCIILSYCNTSVREEAVLRRRIPF